MPVATVAGEVGVADAGPAWGVAGEVGVADAVPAWGVAGEVGGEAVAIVYGHFFCSGFYD